MGCNPREGIHLGAVLRAIRAVGARDQHQTFAVEKEPVVGIEIHTVDEAVLDQRGTAAGDLLEAAQRPAEASDAVGAVTGVVERDLRLHPGGSLGKVDRDRVRRRAVAADGERPLERTDRHVLAEDRQRRHDADRRWREFGDHALLTGRVPERIQIVLQPALARDRIDLIPVIAVGIGAVGRFPGIGQAVLIGIRKEHVVGIRGKLVDEHIGDVAAEKVEALQQADPPLEAEVGPRHLSIDEHIPHAADDVVPQSQAQERGSTLFHRIEREGGCQRIPHRFFAGIDRVVIPAIGPDLAERTLVIELKGDLAAVQVERGRAAGRIRRRLDPQIDESHLLRWIPIEIPAYARLAGGAGFR
ncbi:hypothetical protein Hsar01_04107 [Haloferula sargassicola]|uniref:Uncharacterized protein n=1 Tax=Haloferula sargassicola TaxID=490096 RepID=A0ABP9UU10_9BACT